MSSNVVEFVFDKSSIRTMVVRDEPFFVGRDVAQVLGYADTAYAIRTHCKGVEEISTPSNGGNQVVKIIPERDVYRLIMRSKKPEAEQFEEWVVGTVLPSLRKTGGYVVGEEHVQSEDEMIYLAMQMMERKIREMKPKAEYHDQWMSSEGTYTTSQVAKQLGISARKLNQFLKQEGVKWQNKDLPKAGYEDWFKVIEVAYDNKQTGETGINTQCRVNTEGVQEILSLYQKKAG